jgi:hypothetical protein
MTMPRLTDKLVALLPVPPVGNERTTDTEVPGFCAVVTAADVRSLALRYRLNGKQRLVTIGKFPTWTTTAARHRAKELRRLVDQGRDPKAEREAQRRAPTIADLAERYDAEHLPGKRPRSADEDRALIKAYILPALGKLKAAEVTIEDVRRLHRRITADGKPIRANRVLACLRTMLALAVAWKMRSDNPARGGREGVQMNPEDHRERFLSPAELARLAAVLDQHPERTRWR